MAVSASGSDVRWRGSAPRSGTWTRRRPRKCGASAPVLRHERAGRDEPRLDIGRVQRVELRPQYVGLEAQRRQRRLLLVAGPRLAPDEGQAELDVARRLVQPGPEIGQRPLV